jgi:hypothetical protein
MELWIKTKRNKLKLLGNSSPLLGGPRVVRQRQELFVHALPLRLRGRTFLLSQKVSQHFSDKNRVFAVSQYNSFSINFDFQIKARWLLCSIVFILKLFFIFLT